MSWARHPGSLCRSPRKTSDFLSLGFLRPPLKDAMIYLICSGFRIGVVSADVPPPCSTVAAIVFRRVLPCSSISTDAIGDGGSGVVVLVALSSMKALVTPSPSDERSRFSARGSMSFSLLVAVLSVCYVVLVDASKCYNSLFSGGYLQQVTDSFLTITSSVP